MAKNSGNTRNIGNSRQAITERGFSRRLEREILSLENSIRRNRDESLHFFNQKGESVALQGKGPEVRIPLHFKSPENAILTHNHPRSIGKSGVLSIGNSFSKEDLMTAINFNAAEIRAVTPTYTYSMKRPEKGWNATQDEVRSYYIKTNRQVRKELERYVWRVNTEDAVRRATALHYHIVNKRVATHFGWNYSKKNS